MIYCLQKTKNLKSWVILVAHYQDCPQILREFLTYHETIKGQSKKTISEYYLDLRMFFRFLKLMKQEMPYETALDTISIQDIDLEFIKTITITDVYDFLSYLANDRELPTGAQQDVSGIGAAARARKLSAIKSFFKYLSHLWCQTNLWNKQYRFFTIFTTSSIKLM